jgi:hypothetical protein
VSFGDSDDNDRLVPADPLPSPLDLLLHARELVMQARFVHVTRLYAQAA